MVSVKLKCYLLPQQYARMELKGLTGGDAQKSNFNNIDCLYNEL